ncbi:MAG: BLUF domain-containing protein [Novosphingobium sp.]
MRRLVYVSTADNVSDQDLGEILGSATRNNARDGITGFLLYNDRNFLQLIEGEDQAIGDLIAAIEADTRHHGVARLYDDQVVDRCSPAWSMHHVMLGREPSRRLDELRSVMPVLDDWTANLISNFAHLN